MITILVPTDFSESAGNAINFAVQTSKYMPLSIIVLHSFEMQENIYTDYVGLDKEYKRELLADINQKLDSIKKNIKDKDGVVVESILSTKPLFVALKDITEQREIDLVVMGTLGATGFQGKLFGSNTAAWVEKSSIPVMVVPAEYKWKQPRKMVLATNRFEEGNLHLNELFFKAAKTLKASVDIVVISGNENDSAPDFINDDRKVMEYQHNLQKAFGDMILKVSHLRGSDFEETLQSYITENDIDILAMITYQKEKNFWQKLFSTSITKRMVYHTQIPILAIPGE